MAESHNMLYFAVILAVAGVVLQTFAPDLIGGFAPYFTGPIVVVLGIYVLMLFLTSALKEEGHTETIMGDLIPMIIISVVLAIYFGLNMGVLLIFIVLMILAPFLGKAIHGGFRRAAGEMAAFGTHGEERERAISEVSGETHRKPFTAEEVATPQQMNDLSSKVKLLKSKIKRFEKAVKSGKGVDAANSAMTSAYDDLEIYFGTIKENVDRSTKKEVENILKKAKAHGV